MKSIFSVFQKGLQKTATTISRSLESIFKDAKVWDEETYKRLESALISADFGVGVSANLIRDIRERYEHGGLKTSSDIFEVVTTDVKKILVDNSRPLSFPENKLHVILLVGVNGSGKTTTAGKLASMWKADGKKVMLAACDTFRAAAVDQLKLWGERTGCNVVSSIAGADPSSVAFDAVQSALSKNYDFLIIDTAGRQHTRKGLMDELSKMCRVIKKVYPEAPQEVWLTIDACTGANALYQAKEFTQTAGVTGLVLTKLDGTGKGGMLVAIHQDLKLPVLFVGLGEQPEDFQPFDPEYFSKALFREHLQG